MNIVERLHASAARLPDKTALIAPDATRTYAELVDRVDRGAGALAALGLVRGDRVAIVGGNRAVFLEGCFAALRAGLVAVPVNATYTAAELTRILSDAGVRAVLVTSECSATVADAREGSAVQHVVVLDDEGEGGWAARSAAAAPTGLTVADDDLALLCYTSGTTGRPKGAMLTHRNLATNHDQMAASRLRVEERDVVACALPLFHIYAFNVGCAYPLSRGATVLVEDRFDPTTSLATIATHRASVLLGAPPMYALWLADDELARADLASLRFAVSGAAPLPAEVLRRFREVTGVTIWEGYGLTETAPVLTTTAMSDEPRPGSVGRPVPDVELRLVDESGAPVRRGDLGEVVVRGPNVFAGYWQAPEATAAVLDGEGWFATGDVGYAEDGHLYLVDRKSDLILVSGFNVYPREVEEVLYRHPDVAQAAVVGEPHEITGETVKAVVVPCPGVRPDPQELISFCGRSLARFKCPAAVEFADELPLLPSGKVKRRELRAATTTTR